MSQTASYDLDALRASLDGQVTGAVDTGYDNVRRVWNAAIDHRPVAVVECVSAEDVARTLAFANDHGLPVSVRSGAHNMSGAAVADGGVVVDLRGLNHVSVDPGAKRAKAGGGALLGDLDAATQEHGLAVPTGLVSHTGVGGLTLGGGMGWLSRQAGLTADNLVAAQVVTAAGEILRAAEDENADLFWALRGGGGNFGVVTEFEFRLHDVGPLVQFAMVYWPLDQGAAVLRLAREVFTDLPVDHNIVFGAVNAPPAPFVPPEHQLQPGYVLLVTGFGSPESHADIVDRINESLPSAFTFSTPMPYVALQQLIDEANAWGQHTYDKGCYLDELSDRAIEVVTEHVPRKNSPSSIVLFYRLDEAYSAVGEDDTAFSGGRSPRYAAFIIGVCPDPAILDAERSWVRGFWEALSPHTIGTGSYVNAMTEFEDDRVRASYGAEKYARLAGIKATYDPHNVFKLGANILPAGAAG
ncbi:FAD-binding oxidoreductase [Nocardioides sp. HM23]|uniref:FAD-binding oxidoreductase n=1 Tax=Nocardioides bizhenqiangii TaxID=3095076 RepID=UPI002ACAD7E6|nr:FAD-binding oxidoreductase [Nocardioides sp. HM23]MDZ5622241.1 FAD-binding oxidoreductase [Nocardioides sp. HM23]